MYRGDSRRKTTDVSTYSIQDCLNGIRVATNPYSRQKRFNDFAAVSMWFRAQLQIPRARLRRFEASLFDIRQLVQAEFFDSELDAARELAKRGFIRAAGAVAGVVLEKLLAQVAENHTVRVRKKNPTIGDLNDLLKGAEVVDVPAGRQVQRLGDLRNLCDHNREREPTNEEVVELIDGVEKAAKTLY